MIKPVFVLSGTGPISVSSSACDLCNMWICFYVKLDKFRLTSQVILRFDQ
jgi:hypothetical protein